MNYSDYMYDEDYIHDKECAEAEQEAKEGKLIHEDKTEWDEGI